MIDLLDTARILVVDDEIANVLLILRLLKREGYVNVKTTTDPREVMSLYATFQPDLLLLDLHMPYLTGFTVLEQMRGVIPPDAYFPILVLTADITQDAKQKALEMGANDFVTKPIDRIEVLLRIRNLLETRFLHLRLQEDKQLLEERVAKRTHALEQAKIEIIQRLALAAEFRDCETSQHTLRVGQTSALLAEKLGLPVEHVRYIRQAAPLHDVGKLGVPDSILLKAGKLTNEEFDGLKLHTTIGARILSGSNFPMLRIAERIALTHHERWDGMGYPHGLKGEEIPMVGRIVALADVLDALLNERHYKPAWTMEEAVSEIQGQRGLQFDPRIVDAFLDLVEEGRFRWLEFETGHSETGSLAGPLPSLDSNISVR